MSQSLRKSDQFLHKHKLAEGAKLTRRMERELDAYERERDRQAAPSGHDERTLTTLYGVPLRLSSMF